MYLVNITLHTGELSPRIVGVPLGKHVRTAHMFLSLTDRAITKYSLAIGSSRRSCSPWLQTWSMCNSRDLPVIPQASSEIARRQFVWKWGSN